MPSQPGIFTVSQINALVKGALEQALPPRLVVRGEIRDWKHHYSGHCYFLLKDEQAVLPAVMWAGHFKSVRFTPADGMAVLATGSIDVYLAGGKYQFYVEKLDPEGKGALQLAFEQMVAKLQSEGLFDDRRKKPIPAYARRIGVLTSQSGAALHDIHESIQHRWPPARLFFYPVPVQGEGAAQEIASAIRAINACNDRLKLDVLIVGRGGGSLEDLWAFNEEVLARAIAASKIPIISAVGHEVDVTVADLVADARASTPAKAGVVAVPDVAEVLEDIEHCRHRLTSHVRSTVELGLANLRTIEASEVFRRPLTAVRHREQQVDEESSLLASLTSGMIAEAGDTLERYQALVQRIEPHRLLGRCTVELNDWKGRGTAGAVAMLARHRMALEAQANRLEGLNPRSVLRRGYSITTNRRTGLVIRTQADLEVGDLLVTELAQENYVESQVTKK